MTTKMVVGPSIVIFVPSHVRMSTISRPNETAGGDTGVAPGGIGLLARRLAPPEPQVARGGWGARRYYTADYYFDDLSSLFDHFMVAGIVF